MHMTSGFALQIIVVVVVYATDGTRHRKFERGFFSAQSAKQTRFAVMVIFVGVVVGSTLCRSDTAIRPARPS